MSVASSSAGKYSKPTHINITCRSQNYTLALKIACTFNLYYFQIHFHTLEAIPVPTRITDNPNTTVPAIIAPGIAK